MPKCPMAALIILLFASACATAPPKAPEAIQSFAQYDKAIQISEAPSHEKTQPNPMITVGNERRAREGKTPKRSHRLKSENKAITENNSHRLPDPFRPGEKVVFDARYMGTAAGELAMAVEPFTNVNSKKAYSFSIQLRSNKTFSLFYFINDRVQLYLDYERLVPLTFSVHAEEKNKRQEIRTIYNWNTHKAEEWENVIEKDGELKQSTSTWNLPDSSQNLLSAIYYLRTFKLEPGKQIYFPITHDKQTYNFIAEVLRRETLQTKLGPMATLVVRAKVPLKGLFKTKGDTLFWLTDDDRKLFVQAEAEISVGKVTAHVKSIEHGSQ